MCEDIKASSYHRSESLGLHVPRATILKEFISGKLVLGPVWRRNGECRYVPAAPAELDDLTQHESMVDRGVLCNEVRETPWIHECRGSAVSHRLRARDVDGHGQLCEIVSRRRPSCTRINRRPQVLASSASRRESPIKRHSPRFKS